jgi:methionine synthase I (cobalamin-dependent)
MGTQLMFAGLEQGNCGEAWNLTHPERVLAIQRRYAEAGADCILTNTFGGSRIMLNRHSHAGQAVEINRAGVEIARQAVAGKPGYVIGRRHHHRNPNLARRAAAGNRSRPGSGRALHHRVISLRRDS